MPYALNDGETEVTQALWEAVMGSNPSKFKGEKRPVETVSWDDCQEFIINLNEKTGLRFRLPTEAEWEYAARGGNKSRSIFDDPFGGFFGRNKGYKYSGSNTLADVAWYYGNSLKRTQNVKTKSPNELGLYDMSGNVWEWCKDWYGKYSSSDQINPTGPAKGSYRGFRGGCWLSSARLCRVTYRRNDTLGAQYNYLGLRLAL